jgi:hypothetical protein
MPYQYSTSPTCGDVVEEVVECTTLPREEVELLAIPEARSRGWAFFDFRLLKGFFPESF